MSAERRELLRRLSEVGIDLSGADDAWVMQPIKPVALREVVARIRVLDAFAEGPSAVRALSGQPRTMLAPAEVELASRGILARWLGGTPSPRLLFARGRSWPDRRMSRDAASCLR